MSPTDSSRDDVNPVLKSMNARLKIAELSALAQSVIDVNLQEASNCSAAKEAPSAALEHALHTHPLTLKYLSAKGTAQGNAFAVQSARLALKNGIPLCEPIRKWLSSGLAQWVDSRSAPPLSEKKPALHNASMDVCLGLQGQGQKGVYGDLLRHLRNSEIFLRIAALRSDVFETKRRSITISYALSYVCNAYYERSSRSEGVLSDHAIKTICQDYRRWEWLLAFDKYETWREVQTRDLLVNMAEILDDSHEASDCEITPSEAYDMAMKQREIENIARNKERNLKAERDLAGGSGLKFSPVKKEVLARFHQR